MPNPIEYVGKTHKYLETLERGELDQIVKSALEIANEKLSERGIEVFLEGPVSPYNMLLRVRWNKEHEYMDMIGAVALDEASVKSEDALAEEIVQKTNQHIAARKTHGILFSLRGSKFDTRELEDHYVSMDQFDYRTEYLSVDGNRVVLRSEKGEYIPLSASTFRSYTIIRLVKEGEKIRLFDDYDLVRLDKTGTVIDVSKVHRLSPHQLVEKARKPAEEFKGGYYVLERDELTPERVKHLQAVLSKMNGP